MSEAADAAAGVDPRWTARGPLGAPLVVLIHPTRMNRTYWTPQVEALAPTNRIVAMDLPGHGHLAHEPFTLPAAVALVRTAIESERGSMAAAMPTVVVGLSLGGYVAMAFAAEAPELADALVLAGSTAEPTGPRAHPFRALAIAYEQAHHLAVDRLTAAFIRRRYPGGLGDLLVTSGFAYRGGSEALRSLVGEPFLPRLAAYPGTVVLVNGARDVAMRPGERRFLQQARRGRLVRLPGAYHLSSLDRPAEFTAVIRSAVAEAVASRQAADRQVPQPLA
ncbi:MAG: alpha/beta fold hydrolase [Candidatus Limnocylindrales bacterium]